MEYDDGQGQEAQTLTRSSQDLFSSQNHMSRGRLNTLLQGLKSEGNEGMQLQCLLELCDFLSIGTEESMVNVPMDSFVPVLIQLLNVEYNPEIMLISCRALAYLMEALPSSCGSIVNHKGVEPLCAKLLSIDYIDLAEQAIQCLEKISYEYPTVVLQSGGLMAVLSYIDFFAINTQRMCVTIAANLCRQIPIENHDMVEDSFMNLENLLESSDPKIVEKIVVCFVRLTDAFCGNEQKLNSMCKNNLIHKLCQLITPQNSAGSMATPTSNHSNSIFINIIRTLCFMCAVPQLWKRIVDEGLLHILSQYITEGQSNNSSTPSSRLPIDQLIEVLSLINELLPALPQDIKLLLPQAYGNSHRVHMMRIPQRILDRLNAARASLRESEGLLQHLESRMSNLDPSKENEISSEDQEEAEGVGKEEANEEDDLQMVEADEDILSVLGTSRALLESHPAMASATASNARSSEKEEILLKDPELLSTFGTSLTGPIIQVFTSAVNSIVRAKCLSALSKIIVLSNEQILYNVLRDLSISSFLANLLSNSELSVVATCLQICNVLLVKMSDVFVNHFKREGLVFELDKLMKKHKDATAPDNFNLKDYVSSHHLFSVPEYSSPEELNTILPAWILRHSSQIHNTYFLGKEEDKSAQYMGLCKISEKLKERAPTDHTHGDEHQMLSSMIDFIVNEEGMSTFELLESDILSSLYHYLVCPDAAGENSEAISQRGRWIYELLKSRKRDDISSFIKKLQQVVNKLETFPVVSSEISGTAAGIKLMTQPFKLKLSKSPEETNSLIQDYSATNVQADPTSNVSSIEQYISQKIMVDANRSGKGTSLSTPPKIEISLNGKPMYPWETLIQSIEREERESCSHTKGNNDTQSIATHRLWEKTYTLHYREMSREDMEGEEKEEVHVFSPTYVRMIRGMKADRFEDIFGGDESLGFSMNLLKILYHCCTFHREFDISNNPAQATEMNSTLEFQNGKLSAKLTRQVKDPFCILSNSFPDWIGYMIRIYPFLFTCDSRTLFFSTTSFGVARALHHVYNHSIQSTTNEMQAGHFKVGRIPRQKVRVNRSKIIPSAMKVMEMYGKSRSLLEVEYFGEVGTGLGPTLEFFTLVCHEIQSTQFKLWRGDSTTSQGVISNAGGLFPAPIDPSASDESIAETIKMFEFIGNFVAKAILDNRILDLHMSDAMLKSILGIPLHFQDLSTLDNSFSHSIEKFITLQTKYQSILDSQKSAEEKKELISTLSIGGVSIEELSLDFTVPGMSGVELKENGRDVDVDLNNLKEYIQLTVDFHLQRGVCRQIDAFKKGEMSYL